MVVPKPALDLSFDVFTKASNGSGTFYDRSGTQVIATCNDGDPNCPPL